MHSVGRLANFSSPTRIRRQKHASGRNPDRANEHFNSHKPDLCKGHRLKPLYCQNEVRFKSTEGWCLSCYTHYSADERLAMEAQHMTAVSVRQRQSASEILQRPTQQRTQRARYENWQATGEPQYGLVMG